MKILRLELSRFKSIREVVLPETTSERTLTDLVVLIGRNSSGKSNLLEALDYFFREFDPTLERSIGALNQELWFDRITNEPIYWDLTLSLVPNEVSTLFGKDLSLLFDNVEKKDNVRVARQIVATPQDMRWRTTSISVGSVSLVKDMKAVAVEEIAQKIPAKEAFPANLPANLVQTILGNLSTLLRSQFKYVVAARDNVQPPPSFGMRSPNINATLLSQINSLAQGPAADVRRRWTPLRREYESLLSNRERVDSVGGQLFLENTPLWATGGGNQSVLSLVYEVETGPTIMAIEEPENHLHPDMVKKMLRYFQNVTEAPKSRQLFISTHSPFFVDTSLIKSIVALYWDGRETIARELTSKDDLKNALFDIGARPSDILFADLVLVVEGESDKIVLQNWSRILGIPLEDIHAAVIPARGVSKSRYHLKLWCEVAKDVGLPRYIFVDKDGQSEVTKVVTEGFVPQGNTHVLERGSIEDYYPTNLLINALAELFSVTVNEEQIPAQERVKTIAKLLKRETVEWKVPLAEEVSKQTERKNIPREVADFLRRVHSENTR